MNNILFNKRFLRLSKWVFLISFMFCTNILFAQRSQVSGTIVDASGLGFPGVSVLEKNTLNGTTTDLDGNFFLNVNSKGTLVVSFIGFKTQEINIEGKKLLKITLQEDMHQLSQIVVVGYAKKNIKDVTGSIVSISADELAKSPVANFDQALSGRMAGVQVLSSDGTPGSGMNIIIRGGNSVTGDNSPLYVVDGIPMESFDAGTLNTNDIESFDVLKDASATAIYGSRGANGVIIITTKGGKVGPTKVTYNGSIGIQWIPKTLDVLGAYEFVRLQEEIAISQGGTYLESFKNSWGDVDSYKDAATSNWQDEIFRQAIMSNHSVSMSGGDAKTKHYISLAFMDQQGTMIHTGYSKYNGNVKLNHKLNDKVNVSLKVNYARTIQTGENVSGNNRVSILRDAISFRPVEPLNNDGTDNGIDPDDRNNLRFNPVKTLTNTKRSKESDALRANLGLTYDILENLTLNISGGYNSDNKRDEMFQGKDTYQGTYGNNGINARITDRRAYTYTSSNTLSYDTKYRETHKLSVLLGHEMVYKKNDYFTAGSTHMPIGTLGSNSLQMGEQAVMPKSYTGENSLVSYFSRVDYSFSEKYLFTASFRADGSSRFQGNNRWGYFPAVSLGWRVIEEDFMKQFDFISNMKIRAGWGQTGNNKVGDYSSFSQLNVSEYSGYIYGSVYEKGFEYNNLADKNLKWETTVQSNIGLDLSFLKGKLSINIDAYKKNTKDLLIRADLSPSSGFKNTYRNIGEVENKGLEIAISSTNIKTDDFKWTTAFNISFNKNKCISLNDDQQAYYTDANFYFNYKEHHYITEVGGSVGQIYGLVADGLYQTSDFVDGSDYVLKDGIANNGNGSVIPGAVKFVDQNGDGTINSKDRVVIGNPLPKHYGGLTNNFSYKNFDLSIFLQWSYGNDILNANRIDFESPSIKSNFNYFASVADRYTSDNQSNTIHTIRQGTTVGAPPAGNLVSTRIVEDGSFLRLKTLSLGYTFSKKKLKRFKLSKARIYVAGQNLFTLTDYSGYDPEVSVGKYGALTPGLDYSAYPTSATITFGVNLGF